MCKSSVGKFFLGFLLIFASSCSLWRRASEIPSPSPTPFVPAEIKSEIPFSNKEPEIYQVEIIIQTYPNGEKTERKIFTARNAAKRLTIYNPGEKNEVARLETSIELSFSISHARKVYTENSPGISVPNASENDFLTTEWLNQKTLAAFESMDAENGLSKFRVKLGDGETVTTEVLIFIDKNLKIPVRQEFYTINGEQRSLTYSVELKNFKPAADENLFELPKDYKKVPLKDLQEILRQERVKE